MIELMTIDKGTIMKHELTNFDIESRIAPRSN